MEGACVAIGYHQLNPRQTRAAQTSQHESISQCYRLATCESASSHVLLLNLGSRKDIKIENVHRNSHRCCKKGQSSQETNSQIGELGGDIKKELTARIRHVHNARNMPLHRRTPQQQIQLVVVVAKFSEVLDRPQACLLVRHRGVHVVLLAVAVDTEPFKVDVAAGAELWFDRARDEDG
jgi:hypothetical protein